VLGKPADLQQGRFIGGGHHDVVSAKADAARRPGCTAKQRAR
jgi:hypothetical protein